jgi:hypothetical protein
MFMDPGEASVSTPMYQCLRHTLKVSDILCAKCINVKLYEYIVLQSLQVSKEQSRVMR